MPEFIPVLNKKEIQTKVARIGKRISSDYSDRVLVLIGVLKGAFIFLSDLARHIDVPTEIDFVQVSSYGSGTSSSGKIRLAKPVSIDIKGKDVLIVEDIVDTGLTLSFLIDYIKSLGAETVKVCTMIDKRERRETDVSIDYACHAVKEGFLVGYGLDYDERYRDLPEIFHLKF